MIRYFGSFTRRELRADLERPAEIWGGGDISQTEQGEVEDRKTTDLLAVRECEAQRLSLIMGDTNDPKCLGFQSVKPRKVIGRSTSPEGRAVLHQAMYERSICGQEFRWAKEGLCTTEDSQSATRFGGEV